MRSEKVLEENEETIDNNCYKTVLQQLRSKFLKKNTLKEEDRSINNKAYKYALTQILRDCKTTISAKT